MKNQKCTIGLFTLAGHSTNFLWAFTVKCIVIWFKTETFWFFFPPNTQKTWLFQFALHHLVTLVCYLKCLRGCQNVFSKALGGDWGMISTAHTATWGSTTLVKLVLSLLFMFLASLYLRALDWNHYVFFSQVQFQQSFIFFTFHPTRCDNASPLVWLGFLSVGCRSFPLYLPCNRTL